MPEIRDRSIICFSNIEWGIWKQRHHHLMERFARANRVLFVETLGMRRPNLLSGADLRRIGGRLRRAARGALLPARERGAATDLPAGLTLYSPLVVPLHGSTAVRRLNARLVLRDLRRLLPDGPPPILWVYLPIDLVLEVADRLPHDLLVYDCVDEITEFRDAPPALVASERAIISRADLVLASARLLQEKCRALNPRVCYVPNAAEVERFAAGGDEPDDLRSLPHPRVGYVGAIREWFDLDLLRQAVDRFPDATFVLVGDDAPLLAPLRGRANVRILGPRPYEALPAYLAAIDVCLIPFQDTPLIRSTHPIKVYEYLAAGCPVVSTPMREIEHLEEVDVAPPGEPFLAALGRRLASPREASGDERRRRSVSQQTWDARFRQVETALSEAMERPRRRMVAP